MGVMKFENIEKIIVGIRGKKVILDQNAVIFMVWELNELMRE